MRIIVIIFVFSVVYFQQLHRRHSTNGQYLEDPNLTYKPITFDTAHRGSFNISYCTKELLNCWELARAAVLCKWKSHHASICDDIYQLCDDELGDTDDYGHIFSVYESVCPRGEPTYTRLRASNQTARRRGQPQRHKQINTHMASGNATLLLEKA